MRQVVLAAVLTLLLSLLAAATEEDWREWEEPVPPTSILSPHVWPKLPEAPIPREAGTAAPISAPCRAQTYDYYVRPRNTIQLQRAINNSALGTLIELLPRVYDRVPLFNLTVEGKHGTPDRPITICGPRSAVLTAAGNYENKPYVLLVRDSSYIRLLGFTLRKGLKALVVEHSDNVYAEGLRVQHTDQEGVRVRYASTNTVVKGCWITNTGKTYGGTGEGLYVGSSFHMGVDVTLNTQLIGNIIGPNVTAEIIDIKENTVGGIIEGNIFDGSGLSGENYADSWVDVKGTAWLIRNNTGRSTLKDGFQSHDQPGFNSGRYNVFHSNTCDLAGAPGVCVALVCEGAAEACYNLVSCNNVVSAGHNRMSNQDACVRAPP